MKTINDFLQKYRLVRFDMNVTRPRVRFADGYTVSVQAGWGLYSLPRCDSAHYAMVELGYPSAEDDELRGYAENEEDLLATVYAYVPVSVVDKVLQKHGGIVGADFSNDQAGYWKEYNDHAD